LGGEEKNNPNERIAENQSRKTVSEEKRPGLKIPIKDSGSEIRVMQGRWGGAVGG